MEGSLTLCLRGGGADARRREARKRKFAYLQKEFPHENSQGGGDLADAGRGLDREREDSPSEISKRRKIDSPKSRPKKAIPTSSEPDNRAKLELDASEDGSKSKSAKAQRFICFVGQYILSARTSDRCRVYL